ncbi:hypothetical protein EG68_03416 [Paragonimus skrjabini miyazakii]|uniref:Uncharacterized protein n=1 Tax=Paragonimus skrjabini miyazakii TaxID=59628 RepID=A0A8S9YUQ6_9TREM|nr:hypothetical protein EG68_03416 [Paragonimus skrjabini miyazakii]
MLRDTLLSCVNSGGLSQTARDCAAVPTSTTSHMVISLNSCHVDRFAVGLYNRTSQDFCVITIISNNLSLMLIFKSHVWLSDVKVKDLNCHFDGRT